MAGMRSSTAPRAIGPFLFSLALLFLGSCALGADASTPEVQAQTTGVSVSEASYAPDQARELGQVHWGRDHDAVFEAARADGKPVLLLFQEIPG